MPPSTLKLTAIAATAILLAALAPVWNGRPVTVRRSDVMSMVFVETPNGFAYALKVESPGWRPDRVRGCKTNEDGSGFCNGVSTGAD